MKWFMTQAGAFVGVLLLGVATGCSESTSNPGVTQAEPSDAQTDPRADVVTEIASKAIGPEGGDIATPDGTVTVQVPPGALVEAITMTIEPVNSPVAGNVGQVYEIGPSGTQFLKPVTIALRYSAEVLEGKTPTSLAVSTVVDGAWSNVSAPALDEASQTIAGVTFHLSPYALTDLITNATPLPEGYEPCPWQVQRGDFCDVEYDSAPAEPGSRCGWFHPDGTMTLAHCKLDHWTTAALAPSCPAEEPSELDNCGNFERSCEYFETDNAVANSCVSACSCLAGKWSCKSDCGCEAETLPEGDGAIGLTSVAGVRPATGDGGRCAATFKPLTCEAVFTSDGTCEFEVVKTEGGDCTPQNPCIFKEDRPAVYTDTRTCTCTFGKWKCSVDSDVQCDP
jgi:hypothetical protein